LRARAVTDKDARSFDSEHDRAKHYGADDTLMSRPDQDSLRCSLDAGKPSTRRIDSSAPPKPLACHKAEG
jgi:hypothetical protein